LSHVEVKDLATSVLDHEEAVQQLKGHSGHGKEVEGDDYFSMVLEKCQPLFARVTTTANASKMSRHAPFRNNKTKLLKLSVNPRRSPIWVLFRQSSNQLADLLGDSRSATGWSRSPSPVKTIAGAMPADDGLGFYDDKNVSPTSPTMSQSCPEQTID
jgi:hypothetical protein